MKQMNKKGVIESLGALGIGAVTLLVIMVVGFLIAAQVKTSIGIADPNSINANASECLKSVGCNATNTITNAVATIPGWVGLIILVAIGGLLLAMVKGFKR